MRILIAAIAALMVSSAMPVSTATSHTTHLITCDLIAGTGPVTWASSLAELGLEGVDGCSVDVTGKAGKVLFTHDTDDFLSSGTWDIDVIFYSGANYLGYGDGSPSGCGTYFTPLVDGQGEETCVIPADATSAVMILFTGVFVTSSMSVVN